MCAMYPYLRGEMTMRMYTASKMAKELEISSSTFSLKLNGKYPFTLDEAKKIKNILETETTLDELFKESL